MICTYHFHYNMKTGHSIRKVQRSWVSLNYMKQNHYIIDELSRDKLATRGIWGRVQGVEQMGWVNTRPLICQSPCGMASGGQEEPFSRLALAV